MLPQELTDKILDCLYDDKPSLGQCSLVCWAWVPATRFHIFRDITLRRRWGRVMHPQFRVFLDMLAADSCTLAPFVVHLTLEDLDPTPEAGREITQAFSALSRLTSVASLTFDRWQNLGVQPLHNLLPRLTALSELTFTRVMVDSATQLFNMLEMCPSLTSLAIVSVSWGPSPSPGFYSYAGSIRTLRLAGCPMDEFLGIFAPLNSPLQLACKSVEIRGIAPEYIPSICRLLNSIAQSLQHLTIDFTHDDPGESPASKAEELLFKHLDLRKHMRLTSFRVDDIDDSDRPSAILYAIQCALRSPHLEELVFSLTVQSEMQLRTKLQWEQIDDILSSRSSRLDSFQVLVSLGQGKFRVGRWHWDGYYDDTEIFTTLLPRCHARNMLIFSPGTR
ncbi:hypothetical protein MSAN_01339700 [Mycena sanguinolenta]|uniref:F-box domain-containing protein n=1 Tax=Mycena sanguinolenta TaxID=230812 RepID=A0A8H6YE19_9AGAR|nr:hypothetical protein MSAN_01339700 [Mycena sanguinolenta]